MGPEKSIIQVLRLHQTFRIELWAQSLDNKIVPYDRFFILSSNATEEPQSKSKEEIESEGPRNPTCTFYGGTRRLASPKIGLEVPSLNNEDFYKTDFYTFFQCHIEAQIKTQKRNSAGGARESNIQALRLHQTPRVRPGLGCKHHNPTTKYLSAIDIWYFFRCHVGTQIKSEKKIESEGTEKSNIHVLRRHNTRRVARDWVVSTSPRQRKNSRRQILYIVFECHLETPTQAPKANRVGGAWEIKPSSSRLAPDARDWVVSTIHQQRKTSLR